MASKGSIKNNDFSRGASTKGQVSQEDKIAARKALLAAAKNKTKSK
ncbi:MAG: hypothetical protein LBT37_07260 [Lactobacillaceae bacterium]|jgi:hypothetical protein|nr:hypothetical protein [Lactobacillaceae bacterium]